MKIKEETLEKTTKCTRNFACLNGVDICCEVEHCISNDVLFAEIPKGRDICCEVEHCISNELLFVKIPNCNLCPYTLDFGGSIVCSCPIRKEIYNKYGV